ncbi:esterase/lipase family protein [Methanofollis fontis]|uniref:Acetyltransferase n=1 Tax=Methanofollis fontis TaxID=2052832 RepID=A0A483CV91_9EURY|nr:alpha/beta fold hydrolase [Methanofollis fontis]TAJ45401.1 acetyltransferase [Methanofollis fontis]
MRGRRGVPVVLVHGWRSHPGIWKPMMMALDREGYRSFAFDHSGMGDEGPDEIARALQEYIRTVRDEIGYSGPVDLVCHSMGACIARYLLEVIDGGRRAERVRRLIALGPPNNGSAMAEIFHDPVHGPEILQRLAGVFVPRRYDPLEDVIVQAFRPGSPFLARLAAAGQREGTDYRLILTENRTGDPAFFPFFDGKTWERGADGAWRTTHAGDGIVPHADSVIPGAGVEVLAPDPGSGGDPSAYCHLRLPQNPEVIGRVLARLAVPPPGD